MGWEVAFGGPTRGLGLFVSSYDPETGTPRELRRYDVFPPGVVTIEKGEIQAIGGSDSDWFAACLRSWNDQGQPGNQTLFIGRLDDESSRTQVDLGWRSGEYDVASVAWDGEAFAVHSRDNATGEIFVTRVSPSGLVILPRTAYGRTASPGVSYRMSTSPVSGMSYLFDAAGLNRFVSGHDRAGTPFPWAYPTPLNVTIPGTVQMEDSAFYPGAGADDEGGAWVAWVKYGTGGGFFRAAAHVTASGAADAYLVLPVSSGQDSAAVGALSPSSVWIADSDSYDILRVDYQDGRLGPVEKLVLGPYGRGGSKVWWPDKLSAVSWNDERWMSFTEPNNILQVIWAIPVLDVVMTQKFLRLKPWNVAPGPRARTWAAPTTAETRSL